MRGLLTCAELPRKNHLGSLAYFDTHLGCSRSYVIGVFRLEFGHEGGHVQSENGDG
jgi:hypothetical protein